MLGVNDDELYTRWVQFGVFSPIMRLHSSNNEFMGKEPWRYSDEAGRLAAEALRLRHRLLPYIYTMNYRTHSEGRALIEPMYYHYPACEGAYEGKNEYFFGSELIVAPITEKRNRTTLLAGTELWLPEGRFTDIFTSRIYEGGGKKQVFRDLSSIPVLAREGSIIPLGLEGRKNSVSNPDAFEILIYRGNGSFTLYEDDGETLDYQNGAFCTTEFCVSEGADKLSFEISAPQGDLSLIPEKRKFVLSFKDIVSAKSVFAYLNGKRIKAQVSANGFVKLSAELSGEDKLKVVLSGVTVLENPPKKELLTDLISRFQGSNLAKQITYTSLLKEEKIPASLPKHIREPIEEILNG